jgi:PQQ-dependent dehydrogenase (s-GDH family)
MRYISLFFTFFFWSVTAFTQTPAGEDDFSRSILLTNLDRPWDITFSPDGQLWLTEARTYKIFRIHNFGSNETQSVTTRTQVADLSVRRLFPSNQNPWPEGGLMGLAFHPQFPEKPFVYIAYLYRFDGCLTNNAGCFFRKRIERLEYDTVTQQLIVGASPVEVAELPGSNDHNGGRLTIGADGKLYFSQGDMGAGQYRNINRKHQSQDTLFLEGKILRYNLEPDSNLNHTLQWIPADNPFKTSDTSSFRSAIFSIGHRNPQGIVGGWAGGKSFLFASEHGPQSDDELNLIERSGNFGYPFVTGLAEGNFNNINNGPFKAGPTNGQPTEQEYKMLLGIIEPLNTLGSTTATPNQDPVVPSGLRPSVAPSGIDFYGSYSQSNIPGWGNSVLIATLKNANRNPSIMRIKLNSSASASEGFFEYWKENLRYRDIAVDPGGKDIFIITDEAVGKLIRYRFTGTSYSQNAQQTMAYQSAGNVTLSSPEGWEVNFIGSLWQPATVPPVSTNPVTIQSGHTWLIDKDHTIQKGIKCQIFKGGIMEIMPGKKLIIEDHATLNE